MIISEQKLRSVIRHVLLENFLDSKVDSLEAVELDGLKYMAFGYLTHKDKECVMIKVQKKNHQKIIAKGAMLLPANQSFKISNNSASSNFKTIKNEKNAYYAIPVETKGIKFSSVKLATGKASLADYSIEVAGILGGIPIIGEPLDIASAIVAILKDPPDYILAGISLLCAIPAIGTGAVFARNFMKEAGKKGAKEAGKELAQSLAKKGVNFASDMKGIRREIAENIDALKNSSTAQKLVNSFNKTPDDLIKGLDEVKDIVDEMIEGIEDIGAEQGGLSRRFVAKDAMADGLKKEIPNVLKSLKGGKLRSIVESSSKEIFERVSKAYERQIKSVFDEVIGEGFEIKNFAQANKFLSQIASTSTFIGKKIPLPDPPGGELIYENFGQFMGALDTVCTTAGLKYQDVFIGAAKNIAENGFVPTTLTNVDEIIELTIERFRNVKIEQLDDEALRGANDIAGSYGFYRAGEHLLRMDLSKFGEGGSRALDSMGETLQEELIHCIDSCVLSVCLMGDDFAKSLLDGAAEGSYLVGQKLFNPKNTTGIIVPNFEGATTDLIRKEIALSGGRYVIKQGDKEFKPTVKELFDKTFGGDSSNFTEAVEKISKDFKIPKFHSAFFAYWLDFFKGTNPSIEQFMSFVSNGIGYHGNPPEFLAKTFNLANIMKKKGFDPSNTEDVLRFMRKYDSFESMTKDVIKLDGNYLFQFIFEVVKNPDKFPPDIRNEIYEPFFGFMKQSLK